MVLLFMKNMDWYPVPHSRRMRAYSHVRLRKYGERMNYNNMFSKYSGHSLKTTASTFFCGTPW